MPVQIQLETDVRHQTDPIVRIGAHIPAYQWARQLTDRFLALQKRGANHVGRFKLFGYLQILNLGVLEYLIELKKFLPWRADVLIGCEDGDECPETDIALNYKITADRKEEKRRNLGKKIV